MKLDLMKTLKRIEKNINFKGKIDVGKLKVAYEETLRLRSQLIAVIYDKEHFIHIPCHIFNPDFYTCECKEKRNVGKKRILEQSKSFVTSIASDKCN